MDVTLVWSSLGFGFGTAGHAGNLQIRRRHRARACKLFVRDRGGPAAQGARAFGPLRLDWILFWRSFRLRRRPLPAPRPTTSPAPPRPSPPAYPHVSPRLTPPL